MLALERNLSIRSPQAATKTAASVVALVALAALLGLQMFVNIPSAYAVNQVQFDRVEFINDKFEDKSRQQIEVDMSVPGNAVVPVSGTIYFDDRLIGQEQRVPILSPEGDEIGQCLIYRDKIDCSLDDEYVLEHPFGMTGSFRFWVIVELGNGEDVVTDFEIGNTTTKPVEVTPAPEPGPPTPPCTVNCGWNGGNGTNKVGYYNTSLDGDFINWQVRIEGTGKDGIEPGLAVRVEELFDLSLYEIMEGYPTVGYRDHLDIDDQGFLQYPYWPKTLERDKYSVTEGGRVVSFTSERGMNESEVIPGKEHPMTGRTYEITWNTRLRDGGASANYRNEVLVTLTKSGSTTEQNPGVDVPSQGGTANAGGSTGGTISIAKHEDGDVNSVQEQMYAVDWKACDTTVAGYNAATHEGPTCNQGTVSPVPGSSTGATLPRFPVGYRVVANEQRPDLPEGVEWESEFQWVDASGAPIGGQGPADKLDVTIGAPGPVGVIYFKLTNTYTATEGRFGAQKTIIDTDGVGVTDEEFTLIYSYPAGTDPAGNSFPAGSGELKLAGDGTPTFSDPLPLGAELTFSEGTLPEVHGAEWGTPVISPTTLEIREDLDSTKVEVMLTNSIELKPGHFLARKTFSNPDGLDLSDLGDFVLLYEINGVGGNRELILPSDGEPVASPEFQDGATVKIVGEDEPNRPGVDGGEWGTPVITPSGAPVADFVISGDPAIPPVTVVVENPIAQTEATFSAKKVIENPEDIELDPDQDFILKYTYKHNDDYFPGDDMILKSDGSLEISQVLPVDSVVSITEILPTDPKFGSWETPSIVPNDFPVTGGASNQVDVIVTNTIQRDSDSFQARKIVRNQQNVDIPTFFPGSNDIEFAFTLHYEYSPVGKQDGGDGYLTLLPDGTVATSKRIPHGAKVEVMEVDPGELPGTTWGEPELSVSEFIMGDSPGLVTVEATNTINRDQTTFWANKNVVNEDNVDISAIDDFGLEYSYIFPWVDESAAPEDRGGSGVLKLPVDGFTMASVFLPHGTEVSVKERDPLDLQGSHWLDAIVTPESFVLDAAAEINLSVDVTNTIKKDPPPTIQPSDPPTSPPTDPQTSDPDDPTDGSAPDDQAQGGGDEPGLADAGSEIGAILLASMFTLVTAGLAFIVVRRRMANHY